MTILRTKQFQRLDVKNCRNVRLQCWQREKGTGWQSSWGGWTLPISSHLLRWLDLGVRNFDLGGWLERASPVNEDETFTANLPDGDLPSVGGRHSCRSSWEYNPSHWQGELCILFHSDQMSLFLVGSIKCYSNLTSNAFSPVFKLGFQL